MKKIESIYDEFMIVINNQTNMPVGFIYSYEYNTNNQTIYTAIYMKKDFRKSIVGATAGIVFYNYLFKTKPIRKIYCTVYSYNNDSLNLLRTAGFKEEGNLKEHRYINGQYYDMYIMTLMREEFYKIIGRKKLNGN